MQSNNVPAYAASLIEDEKVKSPILQERNLSARM